MGGGHPWVGGAPTFLTPPPLFLLPRLRLAKMRELEAAQGQTGGFGGAPGVGEGFWGVLGFGGVLSRILWWGGFGGGTGTPTPGWSSAPEKDLRGGILRV